MLISLVSAKGSPGVTTAAVALVATATAAGQRALLVELDPAGGDVEALTGATGEPGLLQAAADLRRDVGPGAVVNHQAMVLTGVPALLAPLSGVAAGATIASALETWGPALANLDGLVFADAGRWEPTQPTANRIRSSDVIAVVCRPDVRGAEHVRHILDRLHHLAPRIVLVAVGERPYGVAEIAAVLDVPPAGTLAWDAAGAGALWAKGAAPRRVGGWRASPLARSAASVLDGLLAAAGIPA